LCSGEGSSDRTSVAEEPGGHKKEAKEFRGHKLKKEGGGQKGKLKRLLKGKEKVSEARLKSYGL
jgi:hypothetical protein